MIRGEKIAVKHWLEKTCTDAFDVVESSTHDLAFSMGAFGETVASYPFLFLGSTASGLSANPACTLKPLDHEAFFTIDYKLPMTDLGQTMLFRRIQSNFVRETSIIPAQHKKKQDVRRESETAQKPMLYVCPARPPLDQPPSARTDGPVDEGHLRKCLTG